MVRKVAWRLGCGAAVVWRDLRTAKRLPSDEIDTAKLTRWSRKGCASVATTAGPAGDWSH